MAVDIRMDGNKIQSGKPRKLFETRLIVDVDKDQYAVTADGQRFLLLKPLTETTHIPITVVRNWKKLLEQ